MNAHDSACKYPGSFYWDFHRANLHRCLYDRAVELGAVVQTNSRVIDVVTGIGKQGEKAKAVLEDGREIEGDLVVGADGINSKLREVMLGKEDPPTPTGDLAYRLLLSTKEMMKDPELRVFVEDPQVNYWLGPDAHAGKFDVCEVTAMGVRLCADERFEVNYVLRGGELFNMVLLVPDDMPAGATTLAGSVDEMRALYKDWDPKHVPPIPLLIHESKSSY